MTSGAVVGPAAAAAGAGARPQTQHPPAQHPRSIARFGPGAPPGSGTGKRVAFTAGRPTEIAPAPAGKGLLPTLSLSLFMQPRLHELPILGDAASHRRLDVMNQFSESLTSHHVPEMKLRVPPGRATRNPSPPKVA